MARGKAHSEEVRAQVMAALLAGMAVQDISQRLSIPERTVFLWQKEQFAEICSQKKARISVRLLEYLDETFLTLCAQHKIFRDPKYLQKQSAAENATLHGVIADKGFRLLEAVARLEEEAEEVEHKSGNVHS